MDPSIGVYVIDRFTYFTLEFLEGVTQNSKKTVYELVCTFEFYFKVILIVCFL
jgi:glycosylphosphatidylinositol transamidase (GPIT) subunit GPI8